MYVIYAIIYIVKRNQKKINCKKENEKMSKFKIGDKVKLRR